MLVTTENTTFKPFRGKMIILSLTHAYSFTYSA
ncbi:hypothetical protein [Citrobacter phage Tr1]|nr:hypothetical protein [Citrobacter phage Tr1]